MDDYILQIDCADQKGLIYKITAVIYNHNLNIISNDEFVDKERNHFFMRTEISGEINEDYFLKSLKGILSENVNIKLSKKRKKRIVVMVTKEHHCIAELLIRNHYNELNAEIVGIISNYEDLKFLSEKFNIPYHFVTHKDKERSQHESEILEIINGYSAEYIVLAKYMRILSPDFVRNYPEHIINIHHSFLPAFVGANPYRQAYERGVKIIGATAHFVNDLLDEGPIITQDVIKIDHTYSVEDLVNAGRDVEKIVLSRALKLVFEDRVFINGNKTVIFE